MRVKSPVRFVRFGHAVPRTPVSLSSIDLAAGKESKLEEEQWQ